MSLAYNLRRLSGDGRQKEPTSKQESFYSEYVEQITTYVKSIKKNIFMMVPTLTTNLFNANSIWHLVSFDAMAYHHNLLEMQWNI